MEVNLLDRMLAAYLEGQTPVTMILQNKTRLSGRIKAYDSYIIVLEGPKGELVYRHSISAVMPHVRSESQQKPAPRSSSPSISKSAPAQARSAPAKTKPQQKNAAPSASDSSLNNSMKDGLLKWMQEQKEAKRA